MKNTMSKNFSDMKWLKDTYWYCPAEYMPAIQCQSDINKFKWVTDQTVWHITGYRYRYFWGVVSAVITTPPDKPKPKRNKKNFSFYGSITPNMQVHMNFLLQTRKESDLSTTTTGTGRLTTDPEPSFEMQMSSGPTDSLLLHWAFMLQTTPDAKLPGTGKPGWTAKEMVEGITPPNHIKQK